MASNMRKKRMESLLKREVGTMLLTEMADPRIGFVSVTEVRMSPDLKFARIRVSVLGDDRAKKGTMAALGNARGFVKSRLAASIDMRTAPDILFELDESIEKSINVTNLIAKAVAEDRQAALDRGEEYTALPEGADRIPEEVEEDGEEDGEEEGEEEEEEEEDGTTLENETDVVEE